MKTYKILTVYGLLSIFAASCSQADTYDQPYEPGEACDAPGIFFTSEEKLLSVDKDISNFAEIPVRRMAAGAEISVPLVVNCDDPNVKVPDNVKFEANATDAVIRIDVADLKMKKLTPISITFPEEYINPYAAGVAIFDGNIVASGWEKVISIDGSEGVTFSYLNWADYTPYTGVDPMQLDMYNLGGTSRYKIVNFMNTEMDFTFDLEPSPFPAWEGYCRIVPVDNQVFLTEYEYNSYYNDWWFADRENEIWPEYYLTSNGNELIYYGVTYYWYDNASQNEYCFARRQGTTNPQGNVATYNDAYMGCFAYINEDWNAWSPYLRLNFQWKDPE